jgi:hypothetical protein
MYKYLATHQSSSLVSEVSAYIRVNGVIISYLRLCTISRKDSAKIAALGIILQSRECSCSSIELPKAEKLSLHSDRALNISQWSKVCRMTQRKGHVILEKVTILKDRY